MLAVLYEAGKTNDRLSSIWNVMPMTAGKVKLDQPFDASTLLPKRLKYYRFAGSLDHAAVHRGRIMVGVENL